MAVEQRRRIGGNLTFRGANREPVTLYPALGFIK